MPSSANLVLIAANPKAGARSGLPLVQRLAAVLQDDGREVRIVSDPDQLRELAEREQPRGNLRAVVAAGGDGTAALVANLTPPHTPLAVLPLGTENLLASYLQIPADAPQVARIINTGATTHLDAGVANRRLFLLMAGCGFDADVVHRVHARRTGHIHHLHYLKPILDSVRSYQYPELRIYCQPPDQETLSADPIRAKWAFIVNLPPYAGGLRLAPSASPADGLLDVCTFEHGSWWKGLTYLLGVALEQHASWREFQWIQTQRVRIEADDSVPYQLDGDPGGVLPLDIETAPQRLRLLIDPHRPPQLADAADLAVVPAADPPTANAN